MQTKVNKTKANNHMLGHFYFLFKGHCKHANDDMYIIFWQSKYKMAMYQKLFATLEIVISIMEIIIKLNLA